MSKHIKPLRWEKIETFSLGPPFYAPRKQRHTHDKLTDAHDTHTHTQRGRFHWGGIHLMVSTAEPLTSLV